LTWRAVHSSSQPDPLRPIEGRRGALLRLVTRIDGILFSEALGAECAVVFAKARELGLEDVVSKREGSLCGAGEAAIG
jgi:hypothetical protein